MYVVCACVCVHMCAWNDVCVLYVSLNLSIKYVNKMEDYRDSVTLCTCVVLQMCVCTVMLFVNMNAIQGVIDMYLKKNE